ncbi:MAG: protein kinase domain-containing protein [Planctomycetota bacterium]|jgi:tetratricopeptide (TPR) repeat protein
MSRRTEEIFDEALRKEGEAARSAFLDGACGIDADLRTRVDALLRAHDEAGEFLQSPATAAAFEGPGTQIGRYKLLQLIGEGGMGAVYMAEQLEPVRRKVALKIIKLGMDTKQVIARFEAERQALALTDHANIARVLDAGATDTGRPYFVMELVKGISISDYCDKNNLSVKERLRLFLPICAAIQHAHQRGIIHRDLKPSNVLVTLHDGVPVPKVIDFGIAKATNQRLTEKTLFTEFRQMIGTPEYMSPEQAEMSGLDVDTRTDVYSLGVLLYELLTGSTPFDPRTIRRAGWAEMQRIIQEQEPESMSTRVTTMDAEVAKHRRAEPAGLCRLFRGDLDWIVVKALEKDRTRRYDTPNALADDIRRHLANEPVQAGAPSAVHRVRKFVLRNRVAVLAGTAVLATLVIGLAVSVAGFRRASDEAAHSREVAEFLAASDPETILASDIDAPALIARAHELFDDEAAASSLFSRALELQSAGQYAAAEPLLREALRIWRARHGNDHVHVGIVLGKIGELLMAKGDGRGAETALRESVRITKLLPGAEHMAQSQAMFQLAAVLQNRREFEEAVALMAEAIRIRRATTPNQKVQIAIMVSAYANLLAMAGRLENIEPVLLDTLDSWRAAVGPDSPLLAKVLVQVASYYLETKQHERAEELLREALEACRGRDDSFYYRDVGIVLFIRAVARQDDGSKEHLARRKEIVEYVRGLVEPDSDLLARLLADFCGFMLERGDPKTALDWAFESLRLLPAKEKMQPYFDAAIGTVESVAKQQGKEADALVPIGQLRITPRDAALQDTIRVLLQNP